MTRADGSAADAAAPVTAGGDQEAFAALFDRHRRELQVYCYRMLGSFHEAEDLLQGLSTGLAGQRLKSTSRSLRAWLLTRIATNPRAWTHCGNADAGGSCRSMSWTPSAPTGRCRRPRAGCGWSRSPTGC